MINIIEIKAKCSNAKQIKAILAANNADFKGVDHQIDTYFKVAKGRLKLREGNIENTLIHYDRPNQSGPKQSAVLLYKPTVTTDLKKVLLGANEMLVVVDKKRAIYFIDNVKFHVDEVKGLGTFMEIEAIDEAGTIGIPHLQKQCDYYMDLLAVNPSDLIEVSYSDLLLQNPTI